MSISRVFGQQPIEVLELAEPTRAVGAQLDLVARSKQLAMRAAREREVFGALDSDHEHPPRRRAPARSQREPRSPAARDLKHIHRLVDRRAAKAVQASDGAARPREKVLPRRPGARAGCEQLACAPGAVGDHRQPRRAAVARDVSDATGGCHELGRARGLNPPFDVKAPARPPAGVGGVRERSQPGVSRRAAMVDSRPRDVHDTRAGIVRAQAFLPLLLVAAMFDRGVEGSHPLSGAAGGSPCSAPRPSARRCSRCPGRAS